MKKLILISAMLIASAQGFAQCTFTIPNQGIKIDTWKFPPFEGYCVLIAPLNTSSNFTFLWDNGSTCAQIFVGNSPNTVFNSCLITRISDGCTVTKQFFPVFGCDKGVPPVKSPCDLANDQDADGSPNATDCAPTDPSIHPGATEICGNGKDENCNGPDDDICPCPSPAKLTLATTEVNGCYAINGGAAPYTMVFNDGTSTDNISCLPCGGSIDAIEIKDSKGCEFSPTELSTSNNLKLSDGNGPFFCDNEAVLFTIPKFKSYVWNDGSTNETLTITETGSYYVTVTNASDCTASNFVTEIELENTLTITATPSSALCPGSSVTLTAKNTSEFMTGFLWSTGATSASITVTQTGDYKVVVTNFADCKDSATIKITNDPLKPVINVDGPLTFCSGGNVILDAGNGFTKYKWSNGATTQTLQVISSGTFAVTVTEAGGCTGAAEAVTVIVTTIPQLTFLTSRISCTDAPDGSINMTVSGGIGPFFYHWSNNATTENITGLSAGTYNVTVASQGCSVFNTNGIIVRPEICPVPQDIQVQDINSSQATVSFTTVICAKRYRIEYRIAGESQFLFVPVIPPANSFTLRNLLPGTRYELRIQTRCNETMGNNSAFSNIIVFTTLDNCNVPENLQTTNITNTSARFRWNAAADAVRYRILYRQAGTTDFTTVIRGANTLQLLVNNLIAATNYEWQIRTVCDNGDVSNFSAMQAFITTNTPRVESSSEEYIEANESAIFLYPNPATEMLHCEIYASTGKGFLRVYNCIGQEVWGKSIELDAEGESVNDIDISKLIPGLYLLQAEISTGEVLHQKLVKE